MKPCLHSSGVLAMGLCRLLDRSLSSLCRHLVFALDDHPCISESEEGNSNQDDQTSRIIPEVVSLAGTSSVHG